ncbi:MAG: serine hydrolase [Bacteroidetes bacterium]|nr:serine hydrolase [Bacteroidota bacterium]MBS1540245.1 serine hydrolase [Bacteroidota bacterium]
MNRFLLVSFFFLIATALSAQNKKTNRADSLLMTLSVEEKVGQLIAVPFSSAMTLAEINTLQQLIKKNTIGKLIITHSSPVYQINIINTLQPLSKIPVTVACACAADPAVAFDSTFYFYNAAVLRPIANDTLLRQLKTERLRQLKLLSVNDTSSVLPTHTDLTVLQDKKKRDNEIQLLLTNPKDIFLSTAEVEPFVQMAAKTIRKKNFPLPLLDSAVKKVLLKKIRSQLYPFAPLSKDNLIRNLHTPAARLLKEALAQAAIQIKNSSPAIIPISNLGDRTFASVSIGRDSKNELTHYLSKYANFSHLSIHSLSDTAGLTAKLNGKNMVVVALFTKEMGELPAIKEMIQHWSRQSTIIICRFYESEWSPENFSVLYCPDYAEGLAKAMSEKIFGGAQANRFIYTEPEAASMDSETLSKIETIADEAISSGATPGCEVFIARHGKVVYERAFGTLEYNKKSNVTEETIFDLASVTKVSATLQAVMYLYEKGLIDINKKVSVYLPELKGTNKEDMIIKDVLTHQAGLWPYLPFWIETVKDSSVFKKYYSHHFSYDFPYPVAKDMYASKSMKDSLWRWIIKARVRDKPARSVYDYKYSDMAFYMMQHLAEKILKMPMEDFLQKNIYGPLGAYTTGFLPLSRFPSGRIAPTEKDTLFRKSLLVGYVHDQGAAMHGGIAGHAGLFSSANDLAKLGQMWLNKGNYGGVRVFKPETIDFFTAKQFDDSRRGLGWDKPVVNDYDGPTSVYASAKTFGHTGFTGTCIWVDPEFDLVYVFLSNRVNPDMNNPKLGNANIRPRIQDVIYRSIFNYCN